MVVVEKNGTTSTTTAETDLLAACGLNDAHWWGLSVSPASATCTVKVYKNFGGGEVLLLSGSATNAAPYVLEFDAETAKSIRVTGTMSAGTVNVTWGFRAKKGY